MTIKIKQKSPKRKRFFFTQEKKIPQPAKQYLLFSLFLFLSLAIQHNLHKKNILPGNKDEKKKGREEQTNINM